MHEHDISLAKRQPSRHRLLLIALTLFLMVSVCIPLASAATTIFPWDYTLTLTGTPKVGSTLTSTLTPPYNVEYKWRNFTTSSCNLDDSHTRTIYGETSTTFVPRTVDVGKYIAVRAHSLNGWDDWAYIKSNCVGPIQAAYTVTYSANGGSGAVPTDSTLYPTGASVTLLPNGTLVRDGYSFNGWNLTSTTGLPYAAGSTYTMGSSNTVFYANWSQTATYTVIYDGNGNDGGTAPTDSTLYSTGNPVTVMTEGSLSLTGYHFTGWNLTSTTGLPYAAGSTYTMGSSNTVFYANWSRDAPVITALSRNSGPTLTGVLITISGNNFNGATGVTFGGINAMDYTVDSDNQISAFTPAVTSPDTVDVNVTTIGGTTKDNFPYTYTEPTGTVGVFRDGVFYLRNINTAGDANTVFTFGQTGDTPLIGDWTGKGWDSPGVVKDTLWTLRNSNTAGDPEISFHYGDVGDKPIVGDWTDKGWDSPGIVRDNYWYLKNSNTDGPAETVFTYGLASDIPLAGDWTGKGWDSPGVYRAADKTFFLRNSNTDGMADFAFSYGDVGDIPVIWHHDNMDTVGVFRNGVFYLRTSNTVGAADTYAFSYGQTGDVPFTGLWTAVSA